MMHDGHVFWGMHWIWWLLGFFLFIWIFVTLYNIPGKRNKKETPLDILKKRYPKEEISKEEFEEQKKVLEQN